MEYPKWYGQCPSCRQWNTLKEQTVTVAPAGQSVPAWGWQMKAAGLRASL